MVRTAGPSDADGVVAVVAAVRSAEASRARTTARLQAPAAPAPKAAVAEPVVLERGVAAGASSPVTAGSGTLARPAAVRPGPLARRDADVDVACVVEALRRPDVVVLVAEAEGVPVGVLVLRRGEVLPLSERSAAHVDQLAVVPAERRRGVGRALLAAAARAADADGLERLVVSAPPGGREVHRFLARLGFSPLVVQRSASVAALRRSLHALPAGRERGPGEASRREAVERLLVRRRRERGLPDAV